MRAARVAVLAVALGVPGFVTGCVGLTVVAHLRAADGLPAFKAEAQQTLVPGADRATIERFLTRHQVAFRYHPDYPTLAVVDGRAVTLHGPAYLGWWVRPGGVPGLNIVHQEHLVILLDARERVLSYEMRWVTHGP